MVAEIKRFLESTHLLHDFIRSEEGMKLSKYGKNIPEKYILTLVDSSMMSESEDFMPKIENPENEDSFPLLQALFEKSIGLAPIIKQFLDF